MKFVCTLFGAIAVIVTCLLGVYFLKPDNIELAQSDGRAISSLRSLSVATDCVTRAGQLDTVHSIGDLIARFRSITQGSELTEDDRFDPWGNEWSFRLTCLREMVLVRIESSSKPWYATQLVYQNGCLVEYVPLFFFLDAEGNAVINKREKRYFRMVCGRQ